MKTRSIISYVLALILTASLIFSTGCLRNELIPIEPPETPHAPAPTETESPENTDDAFPGTSGPDAPMFDVYTAENIIPVLSACMESAMLSYPGSDVFPVIPVTDEAAYAFLYTYAQANAYVEGVGAALSNYEIAELLCLVYGDNYTYEDFTRAAGENLFEVKPLDDAWEFGMGETYAPMITYTSDEDMPLEEGRPYVYNYESAFEDDAGQINVYVVPDDSAYCLRIVKIEIVRPAV